jgi:hypothetical protein
MDEDDKSKGRDPFVLPRVVVELENDFSHQKISYSLWKILCVRSPVRVLICYQRDKEKISKLKEHLENVIWQGSLTKGDGGDLLIIIGDESRAYKVERWREYFTVYEWRNDRLEKIEDIEW